jgi:hypothetical protein
VLIAVNAILAALSKAKGARQAACLNNLRQWGLATQVYMVDNDDYLPREGTANLPTFLFGND